MFGKTVAEKRQKAIERDKRFDAKQAKNTEWYLNNFFNNSLPVLVKRGMKQARKSYGQGGSPIGSVRLPQFVMSHLLSSQKVRTRMSQRLNELTANTGFKATAEEPPFVLQYMIVTWLDAPK